MRHVRFGLVLGLVVAFASIWAFGQAETGTITGLITDPSGAVVNGAKITVRNLSTQLTRTTASNESGNYAVTNLPPGPYEVVIETSGFAKKTQRVTVNVGSRNEVNAALSLAGERTILEVSGEAAVAVNTETQTISDVITAKQLTELPTLTRDPYALVGTAANVSSTDPSGRGTGYAMNGQRAAGTDTLLDGAENMDLFGAVYANTVPLDSVQEFSVLTSNYTAEYGRASAGVVNVATKSGSNALHGSAYEFNRVSALAANTFDNDARMAAAIQNGDCSGPSDPTCPGRKGQFTRNQFGYAVGGPVKKDKLFFFQSTEWVRIRSSANVTRLIAAPSFVSAANANTQNFFSNVPSAIREGGIAGAPLTASDVMGVVSGISPTSTFGLFAAANPNTAVFIPVTFTVPRNAGGGTPSNRYYLVGRGDWNVSDRTSVYGRYALENDDFFPGSVSYSALAGYDTGEKIKYQNMLLSVTHTFTPTVASQTRLTYNRLNDFQPLGTNPVGPTLFFKGGSATSVGGIRLDLPGYLPESPGSGIPFGGPQNLYQFAQDMSWTHGVHTFRFGAQYIHVRDNRTFGAYETAVEDLGNTSVPGALNRFLQGQLYQFRSAIYPQGKYPCARDLTTGALTTDPTALAACTVTLPVESPRFSRNNRFNDLAFYAQDSWKFTQRLTLNLGLRWEYYGVQHNVDPKLDSNYYLGSGATYFDQIRNGNVQLAPDSPIGELWDPSYKNFAPRVGFAYDLFGDGKTSLRGGYGMSYERNFGNVTFNVIQNPPNYAVIAIVNGIDVPANSVPVTPNNFGPLSGTGSKQLPTTSLRAVNPNIKDAYAQFWSLGMERSISKDAVASLEWSGSHGIHLYDIGNINRPGSGNVIMGDASTSNRLNPRYGDINFRSDNGFSRYNALIAEIRTSNLFNKGLQFKANYTWSHAIDNLSSTFSESGNNFNLGYLDAFMPSLDAGNADFDLRHRFVVSGVWDIPAFKNAENKFLKHALGGWELAPIFTYRAGVPYTIYDCANSGQVCARWIPATKPDVRGSAGEQVEPNLYNWLNMGAVGTAFSYADAVGSSDFATCTGLHYTGCSWPTMTSRNAFVGPNNWMLDLGIYKNFKLSERLSMQFRGEMYNIFNHHNYYIVNDNTDVSAGDFIQAKKGGYPSGSGDERRNVQFALKLTF